MAYQAGDAGSVLPALATLAGGADDVAASFR
jgi:hypothetical protein